MRRWVGGGVALALCATLFAGSTGTARVGPVTAGDWPSWQHDVRGTRYNPRERAITAANVHRLTLRWAYAYPKNGAVAKSQPAIAGGTAYFGTPVGTFVARDARTGAAKWSFDLGSVPGKRTAQVFVLDGPTVDAERVYFGDSRGYFYALDRRTGALAWVRVLDAHPAAVLTSSPLLYHGRLYVGVSSAENTVATPAGKPDLNYPCCRFRGSVVALDAASGRTVWRHYTLPPATRAGSWPSGAPRYGPSGAGVWSTPTLDPRTGTLYVGTGQNYTGTAGEFDTMLALNSDTGAVRWKRRMTDADTWRAACATPDAEPGDCPGLNDGTALDYDLSSMPNIFTAGGRRLVGIGQKNGVFHVFDAHTGRIVWQRQLTEPHPNGGGSGVQWGGSYDGHSLYVATWFGEPGTLFALDPATGAVRWQTPSPADGCRTGGAAQQPENCVRGHLPAVSSSPGVVFEGSMDGKLRAYAARTGRVLWTFDTVRDFRGVNGIVGRGSWLSGGGGAVVAGGMVYVQSGYGGFTSDKGQVLLAFSLR